MRKEEEDGREPFRLIHAGRIRIAWSSSKEHARDLSSICLPRPRRYLQNEFVRTNVQKQIDWIYPRTFKGTHAPAHTHRPDRSPSGNLHGSLGNVQRDLIEHRLDGGATTIGQANLVHLHGHWCQGVDRGQLGIECRPVGAQLNIVDVVAHGFRFRFEGHGGRDEWLARGARTIRQSVLREGQQARVVPVRRTKGNGSNPAKLDGRFVCSGRWNNQQWKTWPSQSVHSLPSFNDNARTNVGHHGDRTEVWCLVECIA